MKVKIKLWYLVFGIILTISSVVPVTAIAQDKPATSDSCGFSDLKDGTVRDSTTGLIWQKADSKTLMTYFNALSYASASRTGGPEDWRLPSKFELHLFYNNLSWKGVDHRNPIFDWGEGDWYWSCTQASASSSLTSGRKIIGAAGGIPIAMDGSSVDCKSFKNEYSAWSNPDGKNLVRCVRGRVSKEYIAKWSNQLSDKDPSKRWEALLTLGFIEGSEAKEALQEIKKLLTDPDDQIREKAKEIIEKIEKK